MKKDKMTPAKIPRQDLYQQITDKIVLAIEKGMPPWRKPWRAGQRNGDNPLPRNATTGCYYSGINVMLLWMAAEEHGFASNRWLTFRQALACGGNVRAGEVSSQAVIFKPWEKQAEDTNGIKLFGNDGKPVLEIIPMLKSLCLFNVSQCENLPEDILGEYPPCIDETGSLEEPTFNRVNAIILHSEVLVNHLHQGMAYYHSRADKVVMPLISQFISEADYWSTLLHELVHSTGHCKRLNRQGIVSASKSFGDEVYAFEELIAELGSAFLCAEVGVFGDVQHESYIDNWLRVLKDDKRAIFHACRFAREAVEYLLKHEHFINLDQQDAASAEALLS
ncbi:ssDNA-binding domain-containing protein [Rouxiella badensis]|uniref:ArdC family protein n=1 Tax=Rouxiella badensis TaxID=1646377 RepID=UPI001D133119|nr:zincin-like metallopeptidase domain-containing protein [Rouxiella badensis]MCC3705153.1 ssDNA-binding domain-containing protein [Rouxiella badensis]